MTSWESLLESNVLPSLMGTPLAEREINLKKSCSKTNSSLRSSIGPKKKFITYGEVAPRKFVYKVSCLFTKYLLTCGFVTIDGTEKLC